MPHLASGILKNLPHSLQGGNPRLAYARALTVTVWLFCLVVEYWWRQDYFEYIEIRMEGADPKRFMYLGAAAALIGHLTLGPFKWIDAIISFLSTTVGQLFTLFFIYMLVVAPLSVNPQTSAYYIVATYGVLLLCTLFWMSDYRILQRVLTFTGIVLFAWLLVLLLHHGMPRGWAGTIGAINRNMIASIGLIAMACMLFSNNKAVRWGAIGTAIFFAVLVTSRGTMVALAVFLTVYYTLHKGSIRAVMHSALALLLIGFALLASDLLRQVVFEDVMHIHSAARGIESGFSGRVESWQAGLARFSQRPMIGHGFRARVAAVGSHSGYINLLIESGVIGTSLVVGAVLLAMFQRARIAINTRSLMEQSDAYRSLFADSFRHNAIVTAVLCVTLTRWVYEPYYINLGSIASVTLFLMLTSPMYPNMTQHGLMTQHNHLPRTAVRR